MAHNDVKKNIVTLDATAKVGPRRCRDFRTQTVKYLNQATNEVAYIFDIEIQPIKIVGNTCKQFQKSVKQFLSSDISDDVAIQMAFQSIKKGLPDNCKCVEDDMIDGLMDKLSSPSRELPPGYLKWLDCLVSRLFPKCWDSDYYGACARVSPSLSACAEEIRAHGGQLTELTRNYSHCQFLRESMNGNFEERDFDVPVPVTVVSSAGKPRTLTKAPARSILLKPLHKTIYSHLSRKPWLSRGLLKDDVFKKAGFHKSKGALISGDYASATDNLPLSSAKVILKRILSNSTFIPTDVKEYAIASLSPMLQKWKKHGDDSILEREARLATGQLMGSFLSFPLLCIQNYAAFRWTCENEKRQCPVLINGDDILFQSDETFASEWMNTVKSLGLEVERSKTSVDTDFGSFNSTLVHWRGENLTVRETLRMGMLNTPECPHSLGRTFAEFVRGVDPPTRFRAGKVFFERNSGLIRRTAHPASLGFRGALSYRLSKLFNFLDLPLRELPPPIIRHGVVIPPEFITEVDHDAITGDIREMNARETSAWKWSHGSRPSEKTIIGQAALQPRPPVDIPELARFARMTDGEFNFYLSSMRKKTRKESYRPFIYVEQQKSGYRLMNNLIDLLFDPDEPPPPYEVTAEAGVDDLLEIVDKEGTRVPVNLSTLIAEKSGRGESFLSR